MRLKVEGSQIVDTTLFGRLRLGANIEVLGADKTLVDGDPVLQVLDANGVARNLTLPAVGGRSQLFLVTNTAAGAFSITVKNAGATTIGTVAQGKTSLFFSDGATWHVLTGA